MDAEAHVSQPWGGRPKWIPEDIWPASLAYSLSSRPMRDLVSKFKVNDAQSLQIHVHMYTHVHIHKNMYVRARAHTTLMIT